MSQLKVLNNVAELQRINDWLQSLGDYQRLTEADAHRLQFAIEELFVNVVRHAFRDEDEHRVTLTAESDATHLVVTIFDDGIEFDPTQHESPDHSVRSEDRKIGGEGIHISRKLVSSLTYQRADEQNRVTIRVPLGV